MSFFRAVPLLAAREKFSRAHIRALVTPTRLDWVVGGAVLVVYTVAQLLFLLGPHPFDPARYFRTSFDFPHVQPNLWTLRIGLMVPVRVSIAILGPSEAAMYALPVAIGLGLAAAVYATMLVLFGDRSAAVAAALVTVLNANFLLNSSSIFPDTAATATFAAGFFFLLLGGRATWSERWEGRAQTLAAACAGLLFGWTYLIREFSPVLLPVVVAAIVLLRYPPRRAAVVAAAALGTAALEFLYGQLVFGQPFIHLDLLLRRGDTAPRRGTAALRMEHIQGQVDDPADALLVFPRLLVSWRAGWLLLVLLAIFVAALIILRRDRRLRILAIWCFGYWAAMVLLPFVPTPSGRWLLNVTNIRYWYPLFPVLAMGAFGGLVLLLRKFLPTPRLTFLLPSAAPLLAAVVLVPGLVEFDRCASKGLWKNDPASRWDELRAWFSTAEAKPYQVVGTDRSSSHLLPAFVRTTFGDIVWPGSLRPIRPTDIPVSLNRRRSLILLHYSRFASLSLVEKNLEDLRPDWAPLFISSDGMMVVLAYKPAPGSVATAAQPWWQLPPRRAEGATGCGLSPYEPAGESP